MRRVRLQGTDGVRGRVATSPSGGLGEPEADIAALEQVMRREVSGRTMRVLGMAWGVWLARQGGRERPVVLIGWDARPRNAELVGELTRGLHAAGCEVGWCGDVPTPGLAWCVLDREASGGCMVTASHNPVDESGLKLFDAGARKPLPAAEEEISRLAWELAAGEVPYAIDDTVTAARPDFTVSGSKAWRATLTTRLQSQLDRIGLAVEARDWSPVCGVEGLLLDSSRGAATTWLAEWLHEQLGLPTQEVSQVRPALNDGCGAGELSAGQQWTWAELRAAAPHHALLAAVDRRHGDADVPAGQVLGAALDGDGDRCLLLEAVAGGTRVVDGDEVADDWLRAAAVAADGTATWTLATTIESDLGLRASLSERSPPVETSEVAVGDRWLAASRPPPGPAGLPAEADGAAPRWLGAEDSGHLVLPVPHPQRDGYAVIGDGVATLLAALHARAVLHQAGEAADVPFRRGTKHRVTIWDTDRSRWTPSGDLADRVEALAGRWFGERAQLMGWQRTPIDGEPTLLLLEGELDRRRLSLGIRNSGTEAKTAITLRLAAPRQTLIAMAAPSEAQQLDPAALLEDLWLVLAGGLKPWMESRFLRLQLELLRVVRDGEGHIADPAGWLEGAQVPTDVRARLERRWLRDERLVTVSDDGWTWTERGRALADALLD